MATRSASTGQPRAVERVNRTPRPLRALQAKARHLKEKVNAMLAMLLLVVSASAGTAGAGAAFAADVAGTGALANLGGVALGIAAVVIGAVVGVVLLNATADLYIDSVAGLIGTLSTASFGTTFGDSMLDIVVLIVSIVAPFALLGLAIAVIVLKGRRNASS